MSELTGFNRLKHELLTEEEWQEFIRVADLASDDQLRYVRDAANRPTVSSDHKAEPAFFNDNELRLLLLATQNSIPEWLRPHVMASWQIIKTTSSYGATHQVHMRRLQSMLSINWSDVPPLKFNYHETYEQLCLKLPGMEPVIKEVLNHLALLKRADASTHMQPIAFVGPPGVGKTSLVKELAHHLNRPFEQLQLSSICQPEDVTGTAIVFDNASHGRVLDCFIRHHTPSIILFLDEFCELYRVNSTAAKVGSTFIDLLQDGTFYDTFWGIPAHLAPLVFVTINDLEKVPEKIRQRFKIIEIEPYLPAEKERIIQNIWFDIQVTFHLEDVSLPSQSVAEIVRSCRQEGGVRSVREACYALAAEAAAMDALPEEITPEFVHEHLPDQNPPQDLTDKVGRANMVAVDGHGNGTFANIRCVLEDDRQHGVTITGSIKESAQESVRTALMVARRLLNTYDDPRSISIQIGSIGVPKDGPSAGISVFAAIMSAYLDKPLPGDVAFTGEVCNDGSILPVGGVLAKALAAQAAGCTRFFVPKGNIPKNAGDLAIQLIPVRDVQEVREHLNL